MSVADKIIVAVFESDEDFRKILYSTIKEDLNMNMAEFAKHANIPASTFYKIMSGKREPNVKTLRQIIKTIKKLDGSEKGEFIAIIAARPVLDNISETKKKYAEVFAP